jgi:hypothetical protein
MSTLAVTHPTLLDFAKSLDPDGKVAKIVEVLTQTNLMLEDMAWKEGNLMTGHRSVIRTGIPLPTWRKLYGGVQPGKSTKVPVTDTCGMLEAYAEIDKELADLSGNTQAFRASEDLAHLEGMNQELASSLIYASEATAPEEITGFAPRFNSLSAANADNILSGGGSGGTNTSVWLIVWGDETVHGIFPKGSKAGWQMTDKGQVTIDILDGSGGRMEGYRTHYQQKAGLCVKDWRYVVRIPNIDVTALTKDAATGADLVDLMTQALEIVPSLSAGRPVFYCNRKVKSFLRRQMVSKVKQSTLALADIAGKRQLVLDEVPIKRVDALLNTEAAVA